MRKFPRIAVSLFTLLVVPLLVGAPRPAHAQMFSVIHNFTGGGDGGDPETGLTMDRAGNLYGTTTGGGYTQGICSPGGCGTVFKLARRGSGWVLTPIYTFQGNSDGADPCSPVTIGANGTLYGTTYEGGGGACNTGGACGASVPGCGTVFNLTPPAQATGSALGNWNETALYRFMGGSDGAHPRGEIAVDHAGNLDGTASGAGSFGGDCGNLGCGTVYQLTPSGSGWVLNVLHTFVSGSNDGSTPQGGVILDAAGSGSLYGTTTFGGSTVSCGEAFQLAQSGSGWTISILHAFGLFEFDGCNPIGGLIFDSSGDLLGTTATTLDGEPFNSAGAMVVLSGSGGPYLLRYLPGTPLMNGPQGSLIMDTAGNLYGTTSEQGAFQRGAVFKLTPPPSLHYTSLHDFTGGDDGAFPRSNLTLDANGNIFGTASAGGTSGNGVVFEITP
jgi:uncharacterized repeat protein (TIGR03803 family)